MQKYFNCVTRTSLKNIVCFVFSGPPAAGRALPPAAGGVPPPAAGGVPPPAAVVGYDDGSGDYRPPLRMVSSLFKT